MVPPSMVFCFWGLCWGCSAYEESDFQIPVTQCLLAKALVLVPTGMSSCRPRGPVWKRKRWLYSQSVSA